MATGLNGPYVPWNMHSEDGKFLDRMFRPIGDGDGLGSANPEKWSAAAIKLIEQRFKKYEPDSFRNACERSANRELKRRAAAGTTPMNPPPGLFHQGGGSPSAPAPAPPATSADPIADAIDELDKLSLKHNWNLIKGEFEDDDGEKFFAMGQIPWATSADQLHIEMSLGGRSCLIKKKTSSAALKPGVLLKAFFTDKSGNAIHGKNDTHTIAFKKAVKDMRAKSDDPSACVSSETVYFPWEADRKFDEFLIREVFVDGRHEVWMYLRVKRIGNLYEPAPETPAVPLGQPSFGGPPPPPPTNNSNSSSSNSNSNSNAMDTSDDSSSKRSRSATTTASPTDPGPTPGVPPAASAPSSTAGSVQATATQANTSMVAGQPTLADIMAYMQRMEVNQQHIVQEVQKQKSENEGFQTAVAEQFSRVSINAATMDLLKHLEQQGMGIGIPQQLPPLQQQQQQQQIGYPGYGPKEGEVDEEL